ncbi:hypothetical protein DM793_03135 [Paenarthrobacter nitroguajacolicus]|uniref:thiolase family protein n=1 Tax=Paenarthrobacter nitroguajacolicus TaxID=211146 RepID=UPI0015C15DBB|nr:hypothetical protein [Paenarthrobacter nitroguajacolicus]NWL10298.1 hypothetical protein [Paenarthrobacter nitroguajacolicus]
MSPQRRNLAWGGIAKERILLIDGARKPVGKYGGVLKSIPAQALGGIAASAALDRAVVSPDAVDEVIMGCIGQVGPDAYGPSGN